MWRTGWYKFESLGPSGGGQSWNKPTRNVEFGLQRWMHAIVGGVGQSEDEQAKIQALVGQAWSQTTSGASTVHRWWLEGFLSVLGVTKNWHSDSREWYNEWHLDTAANSPLLRWLQIVLAKFLGPGCNRTGTVATGFTPSKNRITPNLWFFGWLHTFANPELRLQLSISVLIVPQYDIYVNDALWHSLSPPFLLFAIRSISVELLWNNANNWAFWIIY